jgi:hypothetical protein
MGIFFLVQHQSASLRDPKFLQKLATVLKKYQAEGRQDTRRAAKDAIAKLLKVTPVALQRHLKDIQP